MLKFARKLQNQIHDIILYCDIQNDGIDILQSNAECQSVNTLTVTIKLKEISILISVFIS